MTPLVYEINTRCWLNELSARAGSTVTLADIPESEFARWRQSGFTHIWLMGVWTSGPRSRAVAAAADDLSRAYGQASGLEQVEVVGSPYAVAEYKVSPSIGGPEALAKFRSALHRRGIRLILDFVPNHVGLDHEWLRARPSVFVQSEVERPGMFRQQTTRGSQWIAHGRDPNFPPWTDTAQLDYRVMETHMVMRQTLADIAAQCDGVRCDMAMLMLNDVFAKTWADVPVPAGVELSGGAEFWDQTITGIRGVHPDFLIVAEAYWGLEPRLQELGFDYTYDKILYDELIQRNPGGVQRRLLDMPPGFTAKSAHFIENHDEPRIASILSLREHRAAAWLILSLPGLRLLHEGQLSGSKVRVPVQFARRCFEQGNPVVEKLYDDLLATLRRTSIGNGRPGLLRPREAWEGNSSHMNTIVIQWMQSDGASEIVAINLAAHRSQCRVSVDPGKDRDAIWELDSIIAQERYRHSAESLSRNGLYFDIEEHGVQIFRFTRIAC